MLWDLKGLRPILPAMHRRVTTMHSGVHIERKIQNTRFHETSQNNKITLNNQIETTKIRVAMTIRLRCGFWRADGVGGAMGPVWGGMGWGGKGGVWGVWGEGAAGR